jgi:hypothetical protein
MKLHLRAAAAIAAVLLGSAAGAAAPAPAKKPSTCTWGASSVTARFVDGRWVVGTPQTSGCTP